jgi:two-component system, chemotaxis family, chemotaxis protein CheY
MAKTIITVDDSRSIRQLVAYTLTTAGYQVLEAGDGREGLEKLKTSKADLVITDLNMPNMDGIAMIRALRTLPSYKFVPILMLTTESQESKKSEGKSAGATGWIVKPFTPEQLLSTIQKVLR